MLGFLDLDNIDIITHKFLQEELKIKVKIKRE